MRFRYYEGDTVQISDMSYAQLQDLSHMLDRYILDTSEEQLTEGEEDLQRLFEAGANAIMALRAKIKQEEN